MEWHVYIDGASSGNPGEAGAGVIAFDAEKRELFSESLYLGHMTNNMAEYEALLAALKKAEESEVDRLFIYTDSQLVAYQMSGLYKIKNRQLMKYAIEAKRIIGTLNRCDIKYIPRQMNTLADKLAKNAIKIKGRRVIAPQNGEESPGIKGQDAL